MMKKEGKPRWIKVTRWIWMPDEKCGFHVTFPVTRLINEGVVTEDEGDRLAAMLAGPDMELARLAAIIIKEKGYNERTD